MGLKTVSIVFRSCFIFILLLSPTAAFLSNVRVAARTSNLTAKKAGRSVDTQPTVSVAEAKKKEEVQPQVSKSSDAAKEEEKKKKREAAERGAVISIQRERQQASQLARLLRAEREAARSVERERQEALSYAGSLKKQARLLHAEREAARSIERERKEAINYAAKLKEEKVIVQDFALLFDCDGVIVETEELHRIAYNKAFDKFGLVFADGKKVQWDVAYYDILQNTVGGGKPKMNHYFNKDAGGWPKCSNPPREIPSTDDEKAKLVDELQDSKTEFYKEIVEQIAKARPGVLELMDAALDNPRVKVGICSAATKGGFDKLVNAIVGKDRLNRLDVLLAGDDVKEKKPSPMIYNMAREKVGIPAEQCIVIEDSVVGLKAAKSAGMKCIITYTSSTEGEDFYGLGADAKVPDLSKVKFEDIFAPLFLNKGAEILASLRDSTSSTPSPAAAPVTRYSGWTPHSLTLKR